MSKRGGVAARHYVLHVRREPTGSTMCGRLAAHVNCQVDRKIDEGTCIVCARMIAKDAKASPDAVEMTARSSRPRNRKRRITPNHRSKQARREGVIAENERLERDYHEAHNGYNDHAALCRKLEAENRSLRDESDRIFGQFERLRSERAAAMEVTSKDGLSSSEWLLRTGLAEQKAKRLEVENVELRVLIANGDFKDVYAEGIEMGKRLQQRLQSAELDWFRKRQVLSDELQSVYAALSESHDEIVKATGALCDFDLTKPRAGE